MAVDQVKIKFENTFRGVMETPLGTLPIGSEAGMFKPYHLLFGALGSCFYHTFLDIVAKKRLAFDEASLEIDGVKREVPPTTLETVKMRLTIKNSSNLEKMQQAVQLAAKYCSIHETISKVAIIDVITEYV